MFGARGALEEVAYYVVLYEDDYHQWVPIS